MSHEENKKTLSQVAQKETEILHFWEKENIFQKSLEKNSPKGEFTFYDGPPFATGLAHYGHILAGTIKDAIPRYKTMCGYHVDRQWGWDCHGLPIERLIQNKFNLQTKKDIEEFGIKQFNEAARDSVFMYDAEWKQIIPRTGRWVDMTNPYTTMDPSFTQSVWWGFGELHKKGLVYESFKVMHVSPLLETTLSNFEVNQGYKDITDLSATVKFELRDDPGVFVLAWTTTPWTLFANVALAVASEVLYVKIKTTDGIFILAQELVQKNFKDIKFEILEEMRGSELVGKSYKPVFEHYAQDTSLENHSNGWKIYAGDFVTTTDGTGIVHIAPAFGEDDLNFGKQYYLPFIQHVKMNGEIKEKISELAGRQAKPKHNPQETDIEVIKLLAHKGSLFSKEKYTHSYPHCWRTEAPLLNYATSSWFIKVTNIKDQLVKNNQTIKWVPEYVGSGRFGNWLKEAKDWAISRSRFWGTPIPIWKSEDGEDVEVISNLEQLKQKTKSTNTYLVMRHGEAEHNTKHIASDTNSIPSHLTQRGIEQVNQVAEKLKNKKIDLVFVSPLIRTQETAQIISKALGISHEQIITDDRICEVHTGFDGKSIEEYRSFYTSQEEKFKKKHGDGETLTTLKQRVGNFFYDINSKYSNKTILIITHEYVLWMLYAIKDGLDVKQTVAIKQDKEEFVETGQIQEFEFSELPHNDSYELDFHRPYIDQITFTQNGKIFKRIQDVFDGWIDSGAMPFASLGYPLSKESFNPGSWFSKSRRFPADFIAEGLDQTRGWFYTLMVWSTILFKKAPFKHVVVNGLVLAEDGKKMSKSLNNYPQVDATLDQYGADSLRYYLLSSPGVRSEDLKFSPKSVDEIMKKIVMRLDNVLSFYEMYKDEIIEPSNASVHTLDVWILARLSQTIESITDGFEKYELDKATRPIMDFVDDLSTWYLRRSRDRFKAQDHDTTHAIKTTRFVLREFAKALAPIMPFKAEDTYLRTKTSTDVASVHLCDWPQVHSYDEGVIVRMQQARQIVTSALELRAKENVKVRQPLQTLEIKTDIPTEYIEIIKDEVNVKDIEINTSLETDTWLDTSLTQELIEEGIARDLIRIIQDLRKGNGLSPEDTISLSIVSSSEFKVIVQKFEKIISSITKTKQINFVSELSVEPVMVQDHKISLEIVVE
jgi:isoleucyl-tRNA synthetase